ncbi:hypothetical protein BX600DRAFT_450235 [Xylariales sp. PMI_506]|nr:hypothetical protein BX600DRAFT_450235 [Xylariales sp. PMI_506]
MLENPSFPASVWIQRGCKSLLRKICRILEYQHTSQPLFLFGGRLRVLKYTEVGSRGL